MRLQFDITLLLQQFFAEMVKLVDTLASGASGRKLVEVQVLFSVPKSNTINALLIQFFKEFEKFQLNPCIKNRHSKASMFVLDKKVTSAKNSFNTL